jgi:hypothetical protein
MVATPELDKLRAIAEISQKIGEFLEWLQSEKHYTIAEWTDAETLQPVGRSIENLLAEYFNINLFTVDKEKQAILDEFRRRNKVRAKSRD